MTKKSYKNKKVSFEEIAESLKPGSTIFLSSGPSIPVHFVSELLNSNHHNLQDLTIIQLITIGNYITNDSLNGKYRLKTFIMGESICKDIKEGKVDFIPAQLVEIPFIFAFGAIRVDVAVVQTSPPDKRGFMSLGLAVDVAQIVIKNASIVVAEVNPNVPHTYGETNIHIDQVDFVLDSDYPLIEREHKPINEVLDSIAWHIANLVEDNSIVTLHVGRIFDAIASRLTSKKGLKIYTLIISDWIIDLIESGCLSTTRGLLNLGPITTSYCYGTKKLYDYVDNNPLVEFIPIMRLTFPNMLQRMTKLVSILNVKSIDLSGESVVYHSGDDLLSGYESKLYFSCIASLTENGKAIAALHSIDQEGKSNIVISHPQNKEFIRSTMGAIKYVATEYGVVNLFGKSIRERALAMIGIAHPDHREKLLQEAKAAGYIYVDQIYNIDSWHNYPIMLETLKIFKDGLEVKLRPIKPSDEDMMRNLFYKFSDESKYLRYFANIRIMPHERMQEYVNIDYKTTMSIIGLIQHRGTERIIAEARYSYYKKEDIYELGFVVDELFQGKGIATFFMNLLVKIAKDNGIKKVSASVLPQNEKMIKIFKDAAVKSENVFRDGILHFTFFL